MKINSFLSKTLTVIMLANYFPTLSLANAEISDRYQSFEGGYITIQDSTEGYIKEIEIFGNSVQDAGSKNLFNSPLEKGHITTDGSLIDSVYTVRSCNFTEVKPGTYYSLGILDYDSNLYIHEYNENYQVLGQKTLTASQHAFKTDTNTKYIKINSYHSSSHSLNTDAKVQLNEGEDLLTYDEYRAPDLSNIQSIGELYVDNNGSPILDEHGKEQYKIDIISNNKNLFDGDLEIGDIHNTTGVKINSTTCIRSKNYISVKEGSTITLSNNMGYANYIYEYDADKNFITYTPNRSTNTVTLSKNTKYVLFRSIKTLTENDLSALYLLEENLSSTAYEKSQVYKKTIILPCQLQKVGNTMDRLYWDSANKRYVVEKKIGSINIDLNPHKEQIIRDSGLENDSTNKFYVSNFFADNGFKAYDILSSNILSVTYDEMQNKSNYKTCISNSTVGSFNMRVPKSVDNADKLVAFMSNLNITAYLPLKNPQLILTNVTSQLKIPTYNTNTHIYIDMTNNISCNIKIIADKLHIVAKDITAEAKANPSSSNISLARMYVNMLPDSLYKDQLQEQLNELFSSDLVLEKHSASTNLDVYIKSENILLMSLNTNSIMFSEYSGIDELELTDALDITISSSLPYNLNAYLVGSISNSDNSKQIDADVLNIRDNSNLDYKKFSNSLDKVALKENCTKGNNINHKIDLKLSDNKVVDADVYKTTIKFEASQQ